MTLVRRRIASAGLIAVVVIAAGCEYFSGHAVPTHQAAAGANEVEIGPVTLFLEQAGSRNCVTGVLDGAQIGLVWPEHATVTFEGGTALHWPDTDGLLFFGSPVMLRGIDRASPWPELGECPDHGRVFWVVSATAAFPGASPPVSNEP